MKFWPLYRIDSKWKIRERSATVISSSMSSIIIVRTWIVDWKMVEQLTTISKWKNIGRANETNHSEQAVLEATSSYNKQIKKWYVVNIEDAQQWVKWSWCPSPMLAKTYDPDKKQSWSKDFDWYKLGGQTLIIQPKLDWVRRIFIMDADGLRSYTRSWDLVPVMEHIKEGITKFILDNDLFWQHIDWELYCDPALISFQELNWLTRKSDWDPEKLRLINYHIYDIMSDRWYMERMCQERAYPFPDSIDIVHMYVLESPDAEQIKSLQEHFINEGYEWAMIRTCNTPYENKRSKSLLKYKTFEDAEFTCNWVIIDKEWRVWSIECTDWVNTFSASVVWTDIYKERLVDNQDEVVGKSVTVHFFWRSVEGIPRFPRFKAVRHDLN